MKITREQYIKLLEVVSIGNSVLGILGDVAPEEFKEKSKEAEEIESLLLASAEDFGCKDITEEFSGKTILKDEVWEEFQESLKEYDDYIFWFELETKMGKRDFRRTETKEERREIEKSHGILPDRIFNLYEKYGEEFETYGIERLEIKSGK